jgi:hypothetical protein
VINAIDHATSISMMLSQSCCDWDSFFENILPRENNYNEPGVCLFFLIFLNELLKPAWQ